jgi:hypothetical protein
VVDELGYDGPAGGGAEGAQLSQLVFGVLALVLRGNRGVEGDSIVGLHVSMLFIKRSFCQQK